MKTNDIITLNGVKFKVGQAMYDTNTLIDVNEDILVFSAKVNTKVYLKPDQKYAIDRPSGLWFEITEIV